MNSLVESNLFIDPHIYFKIKKYSSFSVEKFYLKFQIFCMFICFFVCFSEYPSPPFLKTIFMKFSLQELIGNQQRFSMHTFRLEEEICSPWEKTISSCTESTFETDTCKDKLDSPARSTVLIGHKNIQKGNLVLLFCSNTFI